MPEVLQVVPGQGISDPSRNPGIWNVVLCGGVTLPPPGVRGTVKVSISTKLKTDKKGAKGKTGTKDSVNGLEPKAVSIEFRFPTRFLPACSAAIEKMSPDGQPRDLIHPKALLFKCPSVLIEAESDLETSGGIGVITWSGKQWVAPATGGFPVVLMRGMRGKEVTRWQEFLKVQIAADLIVDGLFGVTTEDATKKFQEREGVVPVDGKAGPATFKAASKYGYVPPPNIPGGKPKTPQVTETALAVTGVPAVAQEGYNALVAAGDEINNATDYLNNAAKEALGIPSEVDWP